jgi:hypothetical protein
MTAAIQRVAQAAAETSAKIIAVHSEHGPHTVEGALDAAPSVGTPARYAAVAAAMGLTGQFLGTYQTPLSVADF